MLSDSKQGNRKDLLRKNKGKTGHQNKGKVLSALLAPLAKEIEKSQAVKKLTKLMPILKIFLTTTTDLKRESCFDRIGNSFNTPTLMYAHIY